MAKLTPIQVAQRYALRGDIKSAMTELNSLQVAGDVGANASLAELAAYRANWKEVLKHIKIVFETPSALSTFNVYQDMVMLAARAGMELGDWEGVRKLAEFASAKLTTKEADAAHVEAIRQLADFAARNGTGTYAADDESEDQRKVRFEVGLAKLAKKKKKFRRPEDRLDHLFGLARVYRYYPGAVELHDQERELPDLFDNVVFLASALARCDRVDEAWTAIRSKLQRWWPVEDTQIAPVVLLTDEALRTVMIPERCDEVMCTARGPEAETR